MNVVTQARSLAPTRGRRTTGSLHPGQSALGVRPRRPAVQEVRRDDPEQKDRRRCAADVLVPALPGQFVLM